ncbi:MAG: hypothetical protein C5B59_00950 [Bacteroidetes bacterium]|nr:MAG: hypothetical protein C5B59_00950 [Bacteroidota bacterium]
MRKGIFILSFLTFCFSAHSQDWIYVSHTSDGDKWYFRSNYLSKESFLGRDNVIKIWLKCTHKKQIINKKVYENGYTLELCAFDCKSNQVSLVTYVDYNFNGEVIDSNDAYDTGWKYMVPGSIMETVMGKVCQYFITNK